MPLPTYHNNPSRCVSRARRASVETRPSQIWLFFCLIFGVLIGPTAHAFNSGKVIRGGMLAGGIRGVGKGAWEIAEPLLDARLLKEVIESWTRPLPVEYTRQPLILVGPSAVGKNRLVKKLLADYGKFFRKVVTHTTRLPRFDEVNGTTYNFVSNSSFQELVDRGNFFLEHSVVHNNCYGLALEAYEQVCRDGKISIFEIDIQGAKKLREALAARHDLGPRYLFIAPASIDDLKERLLVRGTESDEEMALRLRNAAVEVQASKEAGLFDKVIVNDDFEAASRALFNQCRFWYPSLPSPSRLRMLQRRIAKVKARASEERDGKRATE